MHVEFTANASVTGEEMQSLLASVGHSAHRTVDRNRAALSGSIFVAAARAGDRLVGLLRLVGDGAYIVHVADLEVHPDFQRHGIGRRLMEMGIGFAREQQVGVGGHVGEFTLFASVGADRFYEKLGFILAPNGMALVDTESRRKYEVEFQEAWRKKRTRPPEKTDEAHDR